MPKYKTQQRFKIPASKLVFAIPAAEGATHSGMLYVPSKEDIDEAVSLMKKNGASFAGFTIWSIDFDATDIKKGDLGQEYSHKPWATTNAISEVTLPPVVSQVVDKNHKKQKEKNKKVQKKGHDSGILNYPAGIGSYDENTVVRYQGKKYKCISALEVELCNDKRYIPNGLHGYLAWTEANEKATEAKKNSYKRIIIDGETPKYPDGIGNYKPEQVVIAGDRMFECREGKLDLCNNISDGPTGENGYQAWTDITDDVTNLSMDNKQSKPEGVEYIYPSGIQDYSGGTVVAVGSELYRCKIGPESDLCRKGAYEPAGKYGSDAWIKVDNK